MHDSARTDLWEPRGSNPPGRPGPRPRVGEDDLCRSLPLLAGQSHKFPACRPVARLGFRDEFARRETAWRSDRSGGFRRI